MTIGTYRTPNKLSFQLGGSALQSLLDYPNLKADCKQIIILQRTHDLYPLYNS